MGMAEVDDNRLIGFGRPGPWPYMWQVQSDDGGQTWGPTAFGAFPFINPLTKQVRGLIMSALGH